MKQIIECVPNFSEGRNRQVRKMCESVGLTVDRLTRISIGPIELGNLKKGAFRHMTEEEVQALYKKE